MNWIQIENSSQINEIKQKPLALIFKHSTRCSISSVALDRLEKNWKDEEMQLLSPYFLDLLRFRELSNQIAREFNIEHQSPQVIVLQNGKVLYHNSHFGISYEEIKRSIQQHKVTC